jgi:hypothetical protein
MTDTQTPGHDEPQPPFEGEPLEAPPLPVTPPVPLDERLVAAEDLAQRAITRAGYELTGYVLTHRTRGAKCIADGKTAVWLPAEQHAQLLKWKRPKQEAPPEWCDQAPPDEVDEGERTLQRTANRLGIPFNSMIPHNTGWFVPGIADAFPTAGEAIEALFELIYTSPDATVYRPGKRGRGEGCIITDGPVPPMTNAECDEHLRFLTGNGPAPVGVPSTSAPKRPPKPAPAPVETPQMGLF